MSTVRTSPGAPLFVVFKKHVLAAMSVAMLAILITLLIFALIDPGRFELASRVPFARILIEVVIAITCGTFSFILFPFVIELPVLLIFSLFDKLRHALQERTAAAPRDEKKTTGVGTARLVGPSALTVLFFFLIHLSLPVDLWGPKAEAKFHGQQADFFWSQADSERTKNQDDIDAYRHFIRSALGELLLAKKYDKSDPAWSVRIASAYNELGEYANAEAEVELLPLVQASAKFSSDDIGSAYEELIAAQRMLGKEKEATEHEQKGLKLARSLKNALSVKTERYKKNDELRKIHVLSSRDFAIEAIEAFYGHVTHGRFEDAFNMIHPERLAEINDARKRRKRPPFGVAEFRRTYQTTRGYSNFSMNLRENEKGLGGARVYRVSFDVTDEVPTNRFYESRRGALRTLFAADGRLLYDESRIVENVKEFFVLPPDAEGKLRQHIKERQLNALFDPLFISELGRDLNLDPQAESPALTPVHRHFIQRLQMLEEDGKWKIREGLAVPVGVAIYGDAPER